MMQILPPTGNVKKMSQGSAPSEDSLSFHTPTPAKILAIRTISIGARATTVPKRKTRQPFRFVDLDCERGGG